MLADGPARVIQTEWHGGHALTLTYADAAGRTGQRLLYRQDEDRLHLEPEAGAWSLDADGHLFKLASEATRISLAYLFDPFLAVQSSILEPLPHQIQAVYGHMLPRQPLRFLLADDPGAGKTIMAGLLIKELMIRGDLERCLVVAPGSLVEQWQDELWQKFRLEFDILTRDMVETSRTGNPFQERHRLIARLDHLARNEDLQARLATVDWDLIVFDEAHKLSARHDGPDVKETKRYRAGRLAAGLTRHLLLMTATPHNGKEDEFELFMALLDPDRFAGRARAGQPADTQDLMRRLVKENLLRFDGRRLFPARQALSPTYPLSGPESHLYERVTSYVREEMNRADRLRAQGEGRRGLIVGFALTTLQRRLASSPQAIHESLVRRRRRLQAQLARERTRGEDDPAPLDPLPEDLPAHFRDDDFDEDDLDAEEREELEGELTDRATAARGIAELECEIRTLDELVELAAGVRRSRADRKWEELSRLLQDNPAMFDAAGERRKLIIFTEHRDTLEYLVDRLTSLIGRPESVVAIHGGIRREARRQIQDRFLQDREVVIMVATDAAGEGINLQRAHLMVNYDLPWNPNRLEQRFGRIHRIGQTEVCWLWNLVAEGTREGEVFQLLFAKLEEQRRALGDQVFDVLGQSFGDRSLRDLLIEAVRHGDQPEVRARLDEVVDEAVGERMRRVVHERALVTDVMTRADVESIRDEMERADARRLQPHFLADFFSDALRTLGGDVRRREPGRFEVRHVPVAVRRAPGQAGLPRSYERITFDRSLISVPGAPLAELMTPGHPLLEAVLSEVLARHGETLRRGTVLIDESDLGVAPRVLVYLDHAIQDGRRDRSGARRVVSRRFEFVEIDSEGIPSAAGWAPYVDYRPATAEERELAQDLLASRWVHDDLATAGLDFAISELVPAHLAEVRRRTLARVERTIAAVRRRLEAEISHWDTRASELSDQERAGRQPRMNPERARRRANELDARMGARVTELEAERDLSPLPPTLVGGALVVPAGYLAMRAGAEPAPNARETERVERAAVAAVMATERSLNRSPQEMARNNRGYDIESKTASGDILFIEVKGRIEGATTVTVTRSEIGVGRNKPDQFILALVEVPARGQPTVRYSRRPFDRGREPYRAEISTNFDWAKMWADGGPPS